MVHTSGFRMSPYADIKPAGDSTGAVTGEVARKLWHRSPGSAG
jgi:error-prone DNA polymerase